MDYANALGTEPHNSERSGQIKRLAAFVVLLVMSLPLLGSVIYFSLIFLAIMGVGPLAWRDLDSFDVAMVVQTDDGLLPGPPQYKMIITYNGNDEIKGVSVEVDPSYKGSSSARDHGWGHEFVDVWPPEVAHIVDIYRDRPGGTSSVFANTTMTRVFLEIKGLDNQGTKIRFIRAYSVGEIPVKGGHKVQNFKLHKLVLERQ